MEKKWYILTGNQELSLIELRNIMCSSLHKMKIKSTIVKNTLAGIVICLDPEHQKTQNNEKEPVAPGSKVMKEKTSSGTAGISTRIPEYELTLNIALQLQIALKEIGAKVVMTRKSKDVDVSNIERANIANEVNAKLFVRIHADGSDNKSVNGISMLIPGSKYINDKVLLSESRKAGQNILDAVVLATGSKARGVVERSDLTGFNWSKVPVVLIEMGFMTNSDEDKELNSKEYQKKIVTGIVEGITKYIFGNKKN